MWYVLYFIHHPRQNIPGQEHFAVHHQQYDKYSLRFCLFIDDIQTPVLDNSHHSFPQMTRESIQPTEDIDWSSESAPPSDVTGQYRLAVENTDGAILPVKADSSSPDLLQQCLQRCLYDEDPGPSRAPPTVAPPTLAPPTVAPPTVAPPTEPERDTDHSYTLPGTQPNYVPSMEPAYTNSIDSQWEVPAIQAPAPQAELSVQVENIKGCSAFSKLQSLHHIRSSGKFSFTVTIKGKIVEFLSMLDLN